MKFQTTVLLSRLGWYRVRLSSRLLLAQALVCVLLLGGIMALCAWAFSRDKTAYVYDVVALKSEKLTHDVLARLEGASLASLASRKGKLAPEEAGRLALAGKLPRLPRPGEFFVMRADGDVKTGVAGAGGRLLVLTATQEGDFRVFPLPVDFLAKEMNVRAWWTVGDSELLGRTPALGNQSAATLLTRPEVVRYLQTGLRNGLLTVDLPGGVRSLAGFEEVPRTNTVVFLETPLAEAMAPLVRFLVGALIGGGIVIALGLVLLERVFRTLWKPVDSVAVLSDRIARGEYAFESDYPYQDEMSGILERLRRMAALLSSREEGLKRMARTIEGSLDTTREMTLAADAFAAVARVHVELVARLRFSGRPEGHLYVAEGGSFTVRSLDPEAPALASPAFDGETPQADLIALGPSILNEGPGSSVVAFLYGKPYIRLAVTRGKKEIVHMAGPLRSRTPASEELFLCRALCASLGVVLENIELRDGAATSARIEAELETAEAMQQNMIRVECNHPWLDVSARCTPAARVGGDWCGVYEARSQECLYVFVADVTGHGVDSALVSSAACGVMRSLCSLAEEGSVAALNTPPEDRLQTMAKWINRSLVQLGNQRYAMTLALACIEPAKRRYTYISCAHTPAWHLDAKSGHATSLPSRGSLLGMQDDVTFHVKARDFSEGDCIFLYTDGLLENQSASGAQLSPRALRQCVQGFGARSARECLDTVMNLQRGILAGAPPEDDTTCLVICYRTEPLGTFSVTSSDDADTAVTEAWAG